jgi:hypothetical protein
MKGFNPINNRFTKATQSMLNRPWRPSKHANGKVPQPRNPHKIKPRKSVRYNPKLHDASEVRY